MEVFRRKYATALVTDRYICLPMYATGTVNHAGPSAWTPAAGDVRIRKDGGSWANIATLPTGSSAGGNGNGAVWSFVLSAGELTCRYIDVIASDAATKAVEDRHFIVETYGDPAAFWIMDPESQYIGVDALKPPITGLAVAASANTITLPASASSVMQYYRNGVVSIVRGTGAGQSQFVSDYNGTTKVATVVQNWATQPDTTSVLWVERAAAIPVDDKVAIAQQVLKLDWSTVSGEAAHSVLNALRSLRNKVDISGGTIRVWNEDASAVVVQFTLTTAPGDPIVSAVPTT